MHPRVHGVLIFYDAFVEHEIGRDQHEQRKLVALAVEATVG